jgi:hypothetical protein
MSSEGLKVCRKCGIEKDIAAFSKHVSEADGIRSHCRLCAGTARKQWGAANPGRTARMNALWYRANTPHVRAYERRRNTGASFRLQDTIWAAQAGRCAICKDPQEHTSAHLDHCHDSGVVRGFLCAHCNRGLGGFRDRPELLRGAAAYLEVHQSTDRETAQ